MSSVDSNLTVSLEPHLAQVLTPLLLILPPELSSKLASDLSQPEIHYAVLSDVSRWSRSEKGTAVLRSKNLEPGTYSMVSLLAGTTTSPSSKLPQHTPLESAQQTADQWRNDRKAITAIFNALLSIGGSGAAMWFAADKLEWRQEWKVMLSFLVATVVAISEAILYIIWQSRKSKPKRRHVDGAVRHKKRDDEGGADIDARDEIDADAHGLRRRTFAAHTNGESADAI